MVVTVEYSMKLYLSIYLATFAFCTSQANFRVEQEELIEGNQFNKFCSKQLAIFYEMFLRMKYCKKNLVSSFKVKGKKHALKGSLG